MQARLGKRLAPPPQDLRASAGGQKSLGGKKSRGFIPPFRRDEETEDRGASAGSAWSSGGAQGGAGQEIEIDERLKNIDPKLVELITNEMLNRSPNVKWCDIAGLDFAKQSVQEIVVWPMLRPDIFTGLRGPPKGLLLFGPPGAIVVYIFLFLIVYSKAQLAAGTGKTMIGKAIASESNSSFFSISASSLMSKWVGEGEKMVRALFAVAAVHQPSVVFIDEIDSLLSQRQDGDFESSRRVKTEFLVQLDGCATNKDDRILLIGATNRPQELDEAARRRMVKRLYIPLPDDKGRRALIAHLLQQQQHSLSDADVDDIVAATKGYSGSDLTALCMESQHPLMALFICSFHLSARCIGPVALRTGHSHNFSGRCQASHCPRFPRCIESSARKVVSLARCCTPCPALTPVAIVCLAAP